MKTDLDRICKGWCPLVGLCDETHLCKDMREIKKIIIRIANQEPIDDE